MSKINDSLYRLIDANFNRAKEGFRVCEDVCRFVLNEKSITAQLKSLRHQLTDDVSSLKIKSIVSARNIEGDIGRGSSKSEFARKDIQDVFYANLQRVKESLRVLEEVTKILNASVALNIKQLRYKVYGIEKRAIKKF